MHLKLQRNSNTKLRVLNVKYQRTLLFIAIALSFSGCAVMSGLQTYDVPDQGVYTTDQGAELNVVQLAQNNIPDNTISNTSNASVLSLFQKTNKVYQLTPGDILSIQLWAYPEITPPVTQMTNDTSVLANGYRIDQNGYIQAPLIGQYRAAGKSLSQINKEMRGLFARYLKTPDVVVRVLSYEGQRYFVNGQVLRSGQYTLNDTPVSIYTALGKAGGINTETGDNTNIQLIRNGQTYNLNTFSLEKQGLSLHNLLIQPNDTIFVNTKQDQKLYVLGESSRTQAVALRDQGMTLSDVLGESGGINPNSASAARIYIMRTNLDTRASTVYQLDLSSFGNFALANQFAMQKNDIVYVDATGLTRWQRVINQIIPFSNALYNIDRLGE